MEPLFVYRRSPSNFYYKNAPCSAVNYVYICHVYPIALSTRFYLSDYHLSYFIFYSAFRSLCAEITDEIGTMLGIYIN